MKKHVVILGAGLSGLSLAWFLKKEGVEVTLIEKSDRVGGWIKTADLDGFLFEEGPHSCRVKKEDLALPELIEELGLDKEVIFGSKESCIKYLFSDGKLQRMPTNLRQALFHPLTRKALPSLIKEYFTRSPPLEDESVHDFFSRRFSPYVTEQFIDPMISGIYAGDPKRLSIRATLPHFYQLQQQYGSVMKGLFAAPTKTPNASSPFISRLLQEPLFSFKKGMETLPLALGEKLKESIRFTTTVKTLTRTKEGVSLLLSNREVLHADHCFSTLPAHQIAPLIAPHASEVAALLFQLKRASLAVVNIGYKEAVHPYKGFGYLIPSKEREPLLGVIWGSQLFPDQNRDHQEMRLSVMLGGDGRAELLKNDEESLVQLALNGISKHVKINRLPKIVSVSRAMEAIPQYLVGHLDRIQEIRSRLVEVIPSLTLTGADFDGVSLNDSVSVSKRLIAKKESAALH